MNEKNTTASYVELSSQAYGLMVDTLASANQRGLAYTKSLWEIVSRPYASTAVETTVRENFDRANQIVALTIGELQNNGAKAAELAEKSAAQLTALQESAQHSLRGLVSTGISNMNYAKATATQQFDDMSKRLDEIHSNGAATVSAN